MSKTKYIKVPVSERLPEEETWQYFNSKSKPNLFLEYYVENKKEMIQNLTEYWLEEVPDREDEMREMLQECLKSFNWISENCKLPTIENEHDAEEQAHHLPYRIQELEKLINELKQTT